MKEETADHARDVFLLDVPMGRHSKLLTCVAANLEAMLNFYGAREALTALGSQFFAELDPARHLLLLQHTALEDSVASWTGLNCTETKAKTFQEVLQEVETHLTRQAPVLIHADAFSVPWNPYCGNEHFDHAFVIDGIDLRQHRLRVVDCYTNTTPYGAAGRFSSWSPVAELERVLKPLEGEFSVISLVPQSVPQTLSSGSVIDLVSRNVAEYGERLAKNRAFGYLSSWLAAEGLKEKDFQWLSLVTWLATRERGLHVEWWREVNTRFPEITAGALATFGAEKVVPAWQQAQSMAYIASQRVKAGRPYPQVLLQILETASVAEVEWHAQMVRWLNQVR